MRIAHETTVTGEPKEMVSSLCLSVTVSRRSPNLQEASTIVLFEQPTQR
jgi:hypothetical protein